MRDFIRENYNEEYDILFHIPSHQLFRVKKDKSVDLKAISEKFKDCTLQEENAKIKVSGLSGLIFNTTEKCNLSCSYCMVNKGNYHSNTSKKSMNLSDYDLAYDFMFRNYPKGTSFVCFFGGEPMLKKKEIQYAVKELERRNREKDLPSPRYSIISNGTMIMDEEMLSFMDEYSIYLSISIDGFKELHDSARTYINGEGSYNVIEKNLLYLKRRGRKFPLYAEATIHKEHILKAGSNKRKGGYHFVKRLYDLGFDAVYVFPVDSKDSTISLDEVSNKDLKDFFFGVYDFYMELLFKGKQSQKAPGHFIGVFANIIARRKNRTCNAGTSTLFVNPEGNIYPCHLLYNSKYQKMGNIGDKFIEEDKLNDIYKENKKDKILACQVCPNRTLCFLWCPGSSMLSNQTITSVVKTRCRVVDITVKYVLQSFGKILETNNMAIFKESFKASLEEYKRIINE